MTPSLRITVPGLLEKKSRGEKIVMLTAYDLPMARLLDEAGVDIILVGDSLGMVLLGYSSTVPVTMEEMLHHTKAVRRGVSKGLLVGDMPFMSFNISVKETVRNAGRFMKEAGCDAVKVEGGQGSVASLQAVKAILSAGIPVLGHLGLTPQTVAQLGGFKVQGRTSRSAVKLFESALELERAGCFGIVLECIPAEVARLITENLRVPTLGIGAGPHCDGQVLVTHDLLGLTGFHAPRFVRRFARIDAQVSGAVKKFQQAVTRGGFPSDRESFRMEPSQWRRLKSALRAARRKR